MREPKIRLVLLWHMHQPYYKDLVAGAYRLPWVRLHALKDYYGMVAMVEEFPNVHMTFNLVPSLMLQLEDYAAGTAQETAQQLAFKPADELTVQERLYILRFFFQANVENIISRYPRYRELYERVRAADFQPERALPFFQRDDIADLQVLSQLAWFEETYLERDEEVRALVQKGHGYAAADQALLWRKQQEILAAIPKAYASAEARGQVELSTSPFYHPILPLLCDTEIAAQAHPGVRLPRKRFRHPEDAIAQLERAIAFHKRLFGRPPVGLWPSEGSVSEEVVRICASLGIRWMATDQQVLSNSLGVPFYRDWTGSMVNGELLYRPHRLNTPAGPVDLIFRDHELSDLIGFVYSRMDAESAAADLVNRILHTGLPLLRRGQSIVVSIILDGENAWEYFPLNGRPFLRALYRRLSEEKSIECVTVSEALERHGASEPMPRLAPGSWINANFDIWLGAEEDNRAWDLLSEAHDFFTEHQQSAPPEQRAMAFEELLIAEGSDWNWWYGPEHSSANDSDFDALFRSHLTGVYAALGHRPPDALAQPIARFRPAVISTPPSGPLSPCIDGRVTSYFEWMGAGFYSPVSRLTTMQGQPPIARDLYYARDEENVYLRLDFFDGVDDKVEKTYYRVAFRCGESVRTVLLRFSPPADATETAAGVATGTLQFEERDGAPRNVPTEQIGRAVRGKTLEACFSLAALGLQPRQAFDFQVSLWTENLPLESLPLEGWLTVPPLA